MWLTPARITINMIFLVFVVSALAGIATPYTINDCPASLPRDHYLQVFGDSCFQFVLYRQRDYFQAEADCENQGGKLAIIKSQDVQNFLYNQLRTTYLRDHGSYEEVWIGLHDDVLENHFMWEDGTPAVYSNWGSGEGPTSWGSGHQTEDCVSMSTYSGKWKDHACVSYTDHVLIFFPVTRHVEYPYICQYKFTPTTITTITTTTTATNTTAASTTTAPTTTQTTTTTLPPPTTTTATTAKTTSCPPFQCSLDCGMSGFKRDPNTGCSICECDN